ncbi:MAG: hypothetical protein IKF38_02160 [Clostridia bacterium]|nr:hypothetical protein [Clostridia bacterium]
MKGSWFKYIFILFAIGIIIFAFVKIRGDEETKKQEELNKASKQEEQIKEITIGIAELDTLNPILSNNQNVQNISRLIYEPLVNLNNSYKPEAALAIEWAKQDATNYIIKLRENVEWSDGTEFNAEDVRYTIDRLKDTPSVYSSNVQYVSQVDVVDDYTIKISLSQEVPFFEYYLTFPIMSRQYYGEEDFTNTEKNSKPLGTGKYKITDVEGSYIKLEKNKNWWNAKKIGLSLEKITINLYSSVGELYNSFKTGSTDLIATTNNNFSDYIGTIGYNFKEIRGREHNFLALNTASQYLSDIQVRKAVAASIDKTAITANVYGSKYYTASFPLEYGSYLYKGNNSSLEYNLEQAKQYLTDGGWTNSKGSWYKKVNYRNQYLTLNLVVKASNGAQVEIAKNIETQLQAQGFRINVIQASDEQYQNYKQNKNYDMILGSTYLPISPDLRTFFGEGNLANFGSEEITQIMNEVKNTTDENILKEKYEKLEQIYNTQIPYISLVNNKYNVLYNSNLVGDVAPNWYSLFYNVEGWYKN